MDETTVGGLGVRPPDLGYDDPPTTSTDAYLQEEKEALSNLQFVPLGGGDEWRVYVPTTHQLSSELTTAQDEMHRVEDIYDPKFKPLSMRIQTLLQAEIARANPMVVLKTSRIAVGKDTHTMSEEELEEALANRERAFATYQRYYGDMVEPALFWIGETPSYLPPHSAWISAPGIRSIIQSAEKSSDHNKSLMCIQRFKGGTPLNQWFDEKRPISPEIQDLLMKTVTMMKETGLKPDSAFFQGDNVRVDENGVPRIIDATLVVDARNKATFSALGMDNFDNLSWKDLLIFF